MKNNNLVNNIVDYREILTQHTMYNRRSFLKQLITGSALITSTAGFRLLPGKKNISRKKTIPGEITTPYPTIHNLAVEWHIEGDENLTGIVTVRFREKGMTNWNHGMPLRRVPAGENVGFAWANKHSGSIFYLKPGTEYEIELNLKDPDGTSVQRVVEAQTRSVPEVNENADIIEIEPGLYQKLETKSGTTEKPVVYRCSNGIATFREIDLKNKKWVFIEGLNVLNRTNHSIGITLNGAENCAVRHCHIHAYYGIVAYSPGATNCCFSDNVVIGMNEWRDEAMGVHGDNLGEGIQITGPGNVICYNKVVGFRDCISTMEDRHVVNQTCIDIHNNDIYGAADDGIEADFCFANCRVYKNRLTNNFVGLSSQPGLGGPTYFIRNVMYNVTHKAFKLARFSQGDVVLHNTVVKVGTGLGGNSPMDYAYFRNNLAIGGPNGERTWGGWGAGRPYAADIIDPGEHSSFDYDAVGVYGTPYIAKIGDKPFFEVEKNGIEKITMADTFYDVPFPDPPIPEWDVPDLRPQKTSEVVDAGIHIHNINDDFNGVAPDIGAYETGQKLPHYGPRSR